MPTSEEILKYLHSLANNYIYVANAWHFIFYLFIAALLIGLKPLNRRVIMLLTLLMASVGIFSGMEGNIFNSIIFILAAIVSIYFSFRPEASIITPDLSWKGIAALFLIVFGLVYPEFLEVSLAEYAYSSPLGLLPCPTLSVITGFALLYNGLGSRKWSYMLSGMGMFYGLLGAFFLGVWIDLALLAGAIVLLFQQIKFPKHLTGGPSDHNHLKR